MPNDQVLARQFSEQLATAEAHLWREMAALGLYPRDGWKIAEYIRESALGGTEMVLRPLHLTLEAPPDLECIVRIIEAAAKIDHECTSPLAA